MLVADDAGLLGVTSLGFRSRQRKVPLHIVFFAYLSRPYKESEGAPDYGPKYGG